MSKPSRTIAEAFNEWMRRYVETPEDFEREWQAVAGYLADASAGREPSYGDTAAAYLRSLVVENNAG